MCGHLDHLRRSECVPAECCRVWPQIHLTALLQEQCKKEFLTVFLHFVAVVLAQAGEAEDVQRRTI